MAKIRRWLKTLWARIRKWTYALLVTIGVVVPPLVLADDVNLSWTNGTTWDDGSALTVDDIQETVIYKQSFPLDGAGMSDPRAYVKLVSVPPTQTSYIDANQANGVHCYVATHLAKNGEESVYSNESCKTIDVRIPGNPTGMNAQ